MYSAFIPYVSYCSLQERVHLPKPNIVLFVTIGMVKPGKQAMSFRFQVITMRGDKNPQSLVVGGSNLVTWSPMCRFPIHTSSIMQHPIISQSDLSLKHASGIQHSAFISTQRNGIPLPSTLPTPPIWVFLPLSYQRPACLRSNQRKGDDNMYTTNSMLNTQIKKDDGNARIRPYPGRGGYRISIHGKLQYKKGQGKV